MNFRVRLSMTEALFSYPDEWKGTEAMNNERRIFTSESVTEGHPDKVCDRVSDSVLDAALAQDPMARVACECAATTGLMLVMGEITTTASLDVADIARKAICEIGYDNAAAGYDGHSCSVQVALHRQSPDIAMGVDSSYDDKNEIGAGDQGMMFGFACNETKELMPAPISYAHNLTRALTACRRSGELAWLRPDGKSQVSVQYAADGTPERIDTVVVSTQHAPDIEIDDLRAQVVEKVIQPNLPSRLLDENTKYYVNPTGRFVIGGPAGDSGLTGRKIIVDTYGGYAAHGGGAFSGKDPTKVDRSGAYMARYIAKNIVAAGLASKCQLQLAYAIGVAHPVSVLAETFGTGKISDEALSGLVRACFDLRPAAIIERLGLRRPIYVPTSAYGHFGREELGLPWETVDMVQTLLAKA